MALVLTSLFLCHSMVNHKSSPKMKKILFEFQMVLETHHKSGEGLNSYKMFMDNFEGLLPFSLKVVKLGQEDILTKVKKFNAIHQVPSFKHYGLEGFSVKKFMCKQFEKQAVITKIAR